MGGTSRAFQDTQYLFMEKNRYCLPIDGNCVPCFSQIHGLSRSPVIKAESSNNTDYGPVAFRACPSTLNNVKLSAGNQANAKSNFYYGIIYRVHHPCIYRVHHPCLLLSYINIMMQIIHIKEQRRLVLILYYCINIA